MATSKTISSRRLAALRGSVDSARQSLAHALTFLDHVAKCCEHEGTQGDLPSLVDAGRRLGYAVFGRLKRYETEKGLLEQASRSQRQLRELLAVVRAADSIHGPRRKWMLFLSIAVKDIAASIENLSEEKMLAWADRLTMARAA